jgi:hypothetical protein
VVCLEEEEDINIAIFVEFPTYGGAVEHHT